MQLNNYREFYQVTVTIKDLYQEIQTLEDYQRYSLIMDEIMALEREQSRLIDQIAEEVNYWLIN